MRNGDNERMKKKWVKKRKKGSKGLGRWREHWNNNA